MKRIKRILMALAICSLSITAVGCSSNGKMSNEDIVKKISESSKSVKSSKANIESKVAFNLGGKDIATSVTMEAESISEPLTVKITGKTQTFGKSFDMNMYITEGNIYLQNINTKEWMNVKDENIKKTLEKRKNSANFNDVVELLNIMQKNVKVEEKLLNQNTKTELSKKEFSYDNYLIKLTGKGNFKYSVDKRIICEETLKENEKPRYVRIKILENSNVEFNGNIIGIIFKDNIKYDDFKNLPSGIFSIDTDLKQGTYKISNTTKDTIIKTISKNNEVKILNLQESHEIKLENEMKLIISGVDYITLEKID